MIATINGLPVYDALITDAETGMMRISLVDDPAVSSNFLAFDEARRTMMYAVQDEERRLVRGVVMRADFPIFRRDASMGEFYVIYKAEEIRKMAEKYLAEGRCNLVNLMHEQGSDVDCVNMVQYFIKGAGVSVEGFDDIADGSLFAEFHILNDALWSEIKNGTYRGFSLEGIFELTPERVEDAPVKVEHSKNTTMSKVKRFKETLAKALQELSNITTDRGILAWDGIADLAVGDAVYIEDAEGNRTPAEDGDYHTEENKVIVVADGKVAEIKDAEVEVVPEADAPETEAVEAEGEETTEETPAEEETEDKDAKIKELEEKVAELEAENASLKEKVAEMQKMSAARPAHQEVETSFQAVKTGNKGLDNLARILSAK